MSQNMVQNVQTRGEQIANAVKFAQLQPQAIVEFLGCYLEPILKEAEARGAAEERAKGEKVSLPDDGPFLIVFQEQGVPNELFAGNGAKLSALTRFEAVSSSYHCRLYAVIGSSIRGDHETGSVIYPANVAALEARVKELEAENAKLKTAQFYGRDEEEGGSEDISTFFDDCEPGTILEIDGYRRVNTKWVLWDGHFPHVFDTEDEARAALTREGGV